MNDAPSEPDHVRVPELPPDPSIGCVACPFCGEDDFDLVGLKHHLQAGYCGQYDTLEAL